MTLVLSEALAMRMRGNIAGCFGQGDAAALRAGAFWRRRERGTGQGSVRNREAGVGGGRRA